jgi:hypothetical protein
MVTQVPSVFVALIGALLVDVYGRRLLMLTGLCVFMLHCDVDTHTLLLYFRHWFRLSRHASLLFVWHVWQECRNTMVGYICVVVIVSFVKKLELQKSAFCISE